MKGCQCLGCLAQPEAPRPVAITRSGSGAILSCEGNTWAGQEEEKNMELSLMGSMYLLPGLYFEMKSKCGENMSDIPGSETS